MRMQDEFRLIELLYQINRRIWRLFAPLFRKEQLSLAELLVLMVMGKQKKSRALQLAADIGVPPSTVTGIVDRLVRQGYLERRQDPGDRRSVCITATPRLESFIRNWTAPMDELLRARLAPMPEARKKRMIADLRTLLESLEQEDGDAERLRQPVAGRDA